MIRTPCFSAVTYSRASSCREAAFSSLSRYFYLGGKRVTVLQNNEIEVKNGSIHWAEAALKIAAYVLLLPFNLLLLPAYLILRNHYRFKPVSASTGEPRESKPDLPPVSVPKINKESLQVLGDSDELMPNYLKLLKERCQRDTWIDPDLRNIKARIHHLLTLEITEKEKSSLQQFDAIIDNAQEFFERLRALELDGPRCMLSPFSLPNIEERLTSIEELQPGNTGLVSLEKAVKQMISPYKEAAEELIKHLKRKDDVRINGELKRKMDDAITWIERSLQRHYNTLITDLGKSIAMEKVKVDGKINIRLPIEKAIAYTESTTKKKPQNQQHAKDRELPCYLEDIKRIVMFLDAQRDGASRRTECATIGTEWNRCLALRQNNPRDDNKEYIANRNQISVMNTIAAEWSLPVIKMLMQIAHQEDSAQYWVKEAESKKDQKICNGNWLQAYSEAREGLALCTQPPIGESLVIYSYLQDTLSTIQRQAVEQYRAQEYKYMAMDCNNKEKRPLNNAVSAIKKQIGEIHDTMLIDEATNGYLPLQQLDRGKMITALSECHKIYLWNLEPIQKLKMAPHATMPINKAIPSLRILVCRIVFFKLHAYLRLQQLDRPAPFLGVTEEDIEACTEKFNPLWQRKVIQYEKDLALLGPAGLKSIDFPVFQHMISGIKSFDTCAQAIKALPLISTDLLTEITVDASKFSSANRLRMISFLNRPFFDERSKTTLMQCWEMVAETTKQQLVQIKSLLFPIALEQIRSAYKEYNELILQINITGKNELLRALNMLVKSQHSTQREEFLQKAKESITAFAPIYDAFIKLLGKIKKLIENIQAQQIHICEILESEINELSWKKDLVILGFPEELLAGQERVRPIVQQQQAELDAVKSSIDLYHFSHENLGWTADALTVPNIWYNGAVSPKLERFMAFLKGLDSVTFKALEIIE